HGLRVTQVERQPIHGGSLRIFVSHDQQPISDSVTQLMAEEEAWGVADLEFYASFGGKIAALRETLRASLQEIRSQGKRIAVYGASAKGSTLLNYFGI